MQRLAARVDGLAGLPGHLVAEVPGLDPAWVARVVGARRVLEHQRELLRRQHVVEDHVAIGLLHDVHRVTPVPSCLAAPGGRWGWPARAPAPSRSACAALVAAAGQQQRVRVHQPVVDVARLELDRAPRVAHRIARPAELDQRGRRLELQRAVERERVGEHQRDVRVVPAGRRPPGSTRAALSCASGHDMRSLKRSCARRSPSLRRRRQLGCWNVVGERPAGLDAQHLVVAELAIDVAHRHRRARLGVAARSTSGVPGSRCATSASKNASASRK